ncbi:MAG TPA: hypothetical protein VND64_17085 [Pirellulales bacterium]|nr:hypothetical protein [Pirellulales bacterium]
MTNQLRYLGYNSVSDAGLAKLAPSDSLEELEIDEYAATAAGFVALVALKPLRAVHIFGLAPPGNQIVTKENLMRRVEIDDGRELAVPLFDLDDVHRALHALRQSHPGIVIDSCGAEFWKRFAFEPRWINDSRIDSDIRRLLSEP